LTISKGKKLEEWNVVRSVKGVFVKLVS